MVRVGVKESEGDATMFAETPISEFPIAYRKALALFDKDGDGTVNAAEIAEAAEIYKKTQAAADGTISIAQLPRELHGPLKAFDVDGDGTVGPQELAIAAQLYLESKDTVKKLGRAVVGLVILLAVLVAAIGGLTAWVVESAKESKVGADGIQMAAGSLDIPVSGGIITDSVPLNMTYHAGDEYLAALKSINFEADDGTEYFIDVAVRERGEDEVRLSSAGNSIVVTVTSGGEIGAVDSDGNTLIKLETAPGNARRMLMQIEEFSVNSPRLRKLLSRGRGRHTLSTAPVQTSYMSSNRAGND